MDCTYRRLVRILSVLVLMLDAVDAGLQQEGNKSSDCPGRISHNVAKIHHYLLPSPHELTGYVNDTVNLSFPSASDHVAEKTFEKKLDQVFQTIAQIRYMAVGDSGRRIITSKTVMPLYRDRICLWLNSTLSIRRAVVKDAGEYRSIVTNTAGEIITSNITVLNIMVKPYPWLTSTPSSPTDFGYSASIKETNRPLPLSTKQISQTVTQTSVVSVLTTMEQFALSTSYNDKVTEAKLAITVMVTPFRGLTATPSSTPDLSFSSSIRKITRPLSLLTQQRTQTLIQATVDVSDITSMFHSTASTSYVPNSCCVAVDDNDEGFGNVSSISLLAVGVPIGLASLMAFGRAITLVMRNLKAKKNRVMSIQVRSREDGVV